MFYKLQIVNNCDTNVMGCEVSVMRCESIKKSVRMAKKQNVSLHKERVLFQELLFQIGICVSVCLTVY